MTRQGITGQGKEVRGHGVKMTGREGASGLVKGTDEADVELGGRWPASHVVVDGRDAVSAVPDQGADLHH